MSEVAESVTAVTGATGFVGRYVARELASRGVPVRGLARDRQKAADLLPSAGVTPVWGDLDDEGALSALLDGAKAVVHCVGIRREFPPDVTFERIHVRGVRALVEAAQAQGVRRIVLISALGTRPDAPTAYHRSKFAGERIVRSSGLDWTILRPSLIHGPDGEFMQMVKGWVLGREAPHFFLPYFSRVEMQAPPRPPKLADPLVQPVRVEDVALAAAEALQRPEAVGEVYLLGGPEAVAWPELLRTVRDAMPVTERGKRAVGLPSPLGVGMARAAELLGLARALPFGPDEPAMAAEDSVCRIEKAERHLGYDPAPFDEAVASYAARL